MRKNSAASYCLFWQRPEFLEGSVGSWPQLAWVHFCTQTPTRLWRQTSRLPASFPVSLGKEQQLRSEGFVGCNTAPHSAYCASHHGASLSLPLSQTPAGSGRCTS